MDREMETREIIHTLRNFYIYREISRKDFWRAYEKKEKISADEWLKLQTTRSTALAQRRLHGFFIHLTPSKISFFSGETPSPLSLASIIDAVSVNRDEHRWRHDDYV